MSTLPQEPKLEPTLEGLPVQVKERICQMVFGLDKPSTHPHYVWPFYHQGFKPDVPIFNEAELSCIRTHGLPPNSGLERIQKSKNADLGLCGASTEFSEIAPRVYYSSRAFVFSDARSCFWFFRRIGSNVSYVKTAIFNCGSGYFLSAEKRSEFDVCEEAMWRKVFEHLQRHHQLDKCVVRFVDFNPLDSRNDLSDEDKMDLTEARKALVRVLAEIRGIKDVVMENQDCEYLGLWERGQVAARMVRSRDGSEDGGMMM